MSMSIEKYKQKRGISESGPRKLNNLELTTNQEVEFDLKKHLERNKKLNNERLRKSENK